MITTRSNPSWPRSLGYAIPDNRGVVPLRRVVVDLGYSPTGRAARRRKCGEGTSKGRSSSFRQKTVPLRSQRRLRRVIKFPTWIWTPVSPSYCTRSSEPEENFTGRERRHYPPKGPYDTYLVCRESPLPLSRLTEVVTEEFGIVNP